MKINGKRVGTPLKLDNTMVPFMTLLLQQGKSDNKAGLLNSLQNVPSLRLNMAQVSLLSAM